MATMNCKTPCLFIFLSFVACTVVQTEDAFIEVLQVAAAAGSSEPRSSLLRSELIDIDETEADYWERIRALESDAQNRLFFDDEDTSLRSQRHIRAVEGSGFSIDAMDDSSGGYEIISDDEDEVGSGNPCKSLRLEAERTLGAYVPRCTVQGDFEAVQCHPNGQCWCVNLEGMEIHGTMTNAPRRPDCSVVDRSVSVPDVQHPSKPNKRPGVNSKPTKYDENGHDENEGDFGFSPKENGDGKTGTGVDMLGNSGGTDDQPPNDDADSDHTTRSSLIAQPGLLAVVIGGAVAGLLCTTLLMMFVVYRMRKKDEGSYALDDPKQKSRDREFFA